MVKQRMTALDVRASVEEMCSELKGLRLLNIYDLSPKTFLFKFGHGDNKKMVFLESGLRLHLTELVREKPKIPSQFTLKIRKHVRAWRLETVTQLQHDRTIDFCFGTSAGGEGSSYHIIIELFSKGNVVLTDHEYRIMLLLRTHKDDDIKMFVRELYPMTKPFEEREEVAAIQAIQEKEKGSKKSNDSDPRAEALRREWNTVFMRHADYETTRSTLSAVHHFGPALADHILSVTGVKSVKKGEMTCDGDAMFAQLLPGMLEAWDIAFAALPVGGYLIQYAKQVKGDKGRKGNAENKAEVEVKQKENIEEGSSTAAAVAATTTTTTATDMSTNTNTNTAVPPDTLQAVIYDDFSPVLLAQYRGEGTLTTYLTSFGKLCDTFFLYTETEKIDQHNEKKTTSVLSKKDKFERDHQRRIKALEREQDENVRRGELIIQNTDKIDEAIGLINGALASGIQWDALRSLLKRRHAEGHPVAYMVHELFLERNAISVLVETQRDDPEGTEEDCDVESCVIEVDLSCTAYANAAAYFAKKKANKAKLEKTIASTAKALAGAEKKGQRLAAKQQTKKAIVKERHRFWWEKFAWFRTSAGDFVLQGKDIQTTEILVHRVMRLGDIFVHCDVDGALPCVLKPVGSNLAHANVTGTTDFSGPVAIHIASLEEAGAWCVSRSSAWESKFSVGAWWVHASQISGGTAAGCYLYDGEKQFLRPLPLALGCGLLFHVRSPRIIDPHDPEELPNFGSPGEEGVAFVPADTATELQKLPPIADTRGPRRRPAPLPQQQQQKQKQQQGNKKGIVTSSAGGVAKAPVAPVQKAIPGKSLGSEASSDKKTSAGMAQLTKHQRKKLKRIQDKYGDQDDEDRKLGALLNGNKLSKVHQEVLTIEKSRQKHIDPIQNPDNEDRDPAQSEKSEEEDAEVVSSLEGEDKKNDHYQNSHEEEEEEEEAEEEKEEEDKENEILDEMSKGSIELKISNSASSRSKAPPNASIDTAQAAAANDADLRREWRYFTSRPQPGDVVEFALAVCAPMSAVVSYKYRAELMWGSAKKGQVANGLHEYFSGIAGGAENASETHAVRSLAMSDMIEQLRGNLKRINARATK